MNGKSGGFTLIELMIVIAILGILIAIALPAYQDFTIRTKNSECLSVVAGAKMSVGESAQDRGQLSLITPTSTGFTFDASSYCASVTIANGGIITAITQNTGGPIARFVLAPGEGDGRVEWDCSEANGVPQSQIPAECR
jgi:type IV pilus assembly protein PilA